MSRGSRRVAEAGIAGRLVRRLRAVARRLDGRWPPALGQVRAPDIAGTRPISRDFGWDRGTPIDRYFIEGFLAAQAADIRGHVLEIGDAGYSRRFGGARITRQDVLHVDPAAPEATIVGDLSVAGTLPPATFDCIVFTQTLQFVFDFHAALAELARALRPGGVLLVTVPGISPLDRGEWRDTWYWSFTQYSLQRLAEVHFPRWDTALAQHGNVFAAIAFLHGLAVEEVDCTRLDAVDAAFPVILTARLRRPAADV